MREKSGFRFKPFIVSGLMGVALSLVITLLLLMAAAALILGGALESSSTVAVNISAALGALGGGFLLAKRSGVGALFCGAAVAIPEFLICMLVGLVLRENFLPANGGVVLAVSMMAGALVGALLGSRRGGSGKLRRKK